MGISKISIDDDYCVLDNVLAVQLPEGGYLAENGVSIMAMYFDREAGDYIQQPLL